MGGRDSQRVWNKHVHAAIFKMDNQQGPLWYGTWNPAQCYGASWMGGEFGGEWIHVYVWLNPFTVCLKLSQHCLLTDWWGKRTKTKSVGRTLFQRQHSSVQSLGGVRLFATPWIAACQASLSITSSRSLLKLMSIESWVMSNHLILCHPLLPSVFPRIKVRVRLNGNRAERQWLGHCERKCCCKVTYSGW